MTFYPYVPNFMDVDREPPFEFTEPDGWKNAPQAKRFAADPLFKEFVTDKDNWVSVKLTNEESWVIGRVA